MMNTDFCNINYTDFHGEHFNLAHLRHVSVVMFDFSLVHLLLVSK